ncbi:MAG: hypothetical protein ACRBBN_02455 [Methyloligellaceae bacterium]
MNIGVSWVIDRVNVALVWRAVQRKLPIITGVMVAAGLFTYLSMSLFTPKYSAIARIYISQDGKAGQIPDAKTLRAQTGAIYADNFLTNIIRTLNLHTHPEFSSTLQSGDSLLEELKSRLQISWKSNSAVLSIRFNSNDPNLAAEATNAIASAFLVTSAERATGVNAQLALRAVTPLSPDSPKRGPIALFVMAAAGLLFFGYIIGREIVSQRERAKEAALDEKHHIVDMKIHKVVGVDNMEERPTLFRGAKAGPAFGGIYSWLPEFSINHIADQLKILHPSDKTFPILVSAEADGIAVGKDALALARQFSAEGKSTLLIDAGDGDLSELLNLSKSSGLAEVIRKPETLEHVVHTDTEGKLQLVGRGVESSIKMEEQCLNNMRSVFSAWCEVYEVVIVCCSYRNACDLDGILGELFAAGVFVQKDGVNTQETVSRGFVGKRKDFDMLFYRQNVSRVAGIAKSEQKVVNFS